MAVNIDFYNKIYNAKSMRYFRRYSKLYVYLSTNIQPSDRVLDIGCGMGYFDGVYLIPKRCDFRGIDISNVGIKKAKESFKSHANCFNIFNILDIAKYPFNYNTIVATEVFEHIDNDIELMSLIKPGTKILFSVPAIEIVVSKDHKRKYTEQVIRERYGNIIDIKSIKIIDNWFAVIAIKK